MIYEQIWGNLIAVDDNAIMVYINRLRSKIETTPARPSTSSPSAASAIVSCRKSVIYFS